MDDRPVFGYFFVAHVSGLVCKAVRFPFAVDLVDLHMDNPFRKRFPVRISMIMTPVEIQTMLTVNINFALSNNSISSYPEIH